MRKSLMILWTMTIIATVTITAAAFLTSCDLSGSDRKVLWGKSKGGTLTISAAASLKDVLEEIKKEYLIDNKDLKVERSLEINLNFGASGALQKQIEEGAPVDVFISAGKSQMEELDKKGLLEPGTKVDLLNNDLVVIVPAENRSKFITMEDLLKVQGKIAIGEVSSVPVGQYSKEALEYYRLWDKLSDSVVYAKDVKQIVAYVENGEVEAGLVYKSDATTLKYGSIVFELPSECHEPIIYPVSEIKDSKNKTEALKFLEYLKGDKAKRIFEKYGFKINT